MNIYVGNLSYDVTDDELRGAFEPFGKVQSATVIKDKYTGESRGFGFIEMADNSEGNTAIESLNGEDLKGRALVVNEARPRSNDRRDRGGNGGGRGGSSRGGGGGGGGGGTRRRF